jgi:choline dehydrogenase-like flavoprotein
MIEDFDHLNDAASLEADVCIIGAGVAGLTIAREFLGTSTRVIMLESGGWDIEDATSALNQGETAGLAFNGLTNGRARAFGGTSNLWGGQCVPLDPIDFERRPWVPHSGWPIARTALAPYYEQAKERLWIPPDEYASGVWERFGLAPMPFEHSLVQIKHTIFIAQHNLGRRYRTALQSAGNIRVLLHANVAELRTDTYVTQMRSVSIRNLHGKSREVRARMFVLCAGAIENARILLLSDADNPAGLGNEHDNVGRFFQEHPVCRCAEIKTTTPRPLQDHFNLLYGRSARTLRHGQGRKYLPRLALSETVQRRLLVLNCIGQLDYEYPSGSAMQAVRDLVVALHMGRRPENIAATLGRVAMASPLLAGNAFRFLACGLTPAIRPARIFLNAIGEQAPDANSRITLSRTRDALGLRKVRVNWQLTELEWQTFHVFAQTVGDEFSRLGLGTVKIADWLLDEDFSRANVWDNFHQTGTTRMADIAANGVVDQTCQVFGVDGLYVAGASVFPTSGTANPVLTITALSLRLAETLKARLRTARAVPVQEAA